MKEIWKPIKNYPTYAVSNRGNVKSLNYRQTGKAKILKAGVSSTGYRSLIIKDKRFKVSRLVASEFLGLDLDNRNVYVDHISGNTVGVSGKLDDSVANLRLVSPRENRTNYTSNKRELPHHVRKSRNKYQVAFQHGSNSDGCRIYLGSYLSLEKAVKVRDNYLEEEANCIYKDLIIEVS